MRPWHNYYELLCCYMNAVQYIMVEYDTLLAYSVKRSYSSLKLSFSGFLQSKSNFVPPGRNKWLKITWLGSFERNQHSDTCLSCLNLTLYGPQEWLIDLTLSNARRFYSSKSRVNKATKNILSFSTYMSVVVHEVIGQFEFVKRHDLFHPLLSSTGWVRVNVYSPGYTGVCFARYQPLGAVKGVAITFVVHRDKVHHQDVLGWGVQSL